MNQNRNRANVTYSQPSKSIARILPEDIIPVIENAGQYDRLRKLEMTLDATIARKKYDIQDRLAKPIKLRKTMRVWISNTVSDQAWQDTSLDFDFDTITTPTWTLKIEGLVVDFDGLKFTDLVRSVVVEDSDGVIMEHHKSSKTASLHGLQMTRKGDSDTLLKISILIDHNPEKYAVPQQLARIVGRENTRSGIVSGVWKYIKLLNLIDSEDKRLVHCDDTLRPIFGDRIFLPELPKMVDKILRPAEPVVIEFPLSIDRPGVEIRDLEVEVIDPFTKDLRELLPKLTTNDNITQIDSEISDLINAMNTSLDRRSFFLQFAQSPVEFLKRWIESQKVDGEVVMGDIVRADGDDVRRGGYYNGRWVQESIFQYLSQRVT